MAHAGLHPGRAKLVAGLDQNPSVADKGSHLNLYDIGGSHHSPGHRGERSVHSATLLRRVRTLEREREQLRSAMEATKRAIAVDGTQARLLPLLMGACLGGALVAAIMSRRG